MRGYILTDNDKERLRRWLEEDIEDQQTRNLFTQIRKKPPPTNRRHPVDTPGNPQTTKPTQVERKSLTQRQSRPSDPASQIQDRPPTRQPDS